MTKSINEFASKHLGQSGSYAVYTNEIDASLLVAMPRELARAEHNINSDTFTGYDVWTAHEMTFLTDKGLPVAGTLKLCYSSNSICMVESKSLKLYLNTFDMTKMGPTVQTAINHAINRVQKDLTDLLEVYVEVNFFVDSSLQKDVTEEYQDLVEVLSGLESLEDIEFSDYSSQQSHLIFVPEEGLVNEVKVSTNLLRSRCRHTKQKDSGSAYIRIYTEGGFIDLCSLLKQVVSLREKDEFHEFCAEMLYTELKKIPQVKECSVMLLYARRGGIDINPVRATSEAFIPSGLVSCKYLTKKTLMQ